MISTIIRLIGEEKGDMQFLYASLAVFAALAVAVGEGLSESASGWFRAVVALIGL